MKSAAHLIALFLQSEGLGTLGTDLHVGTEPATPNDCVTIYDTGALRPALIGGSENTGYRTARHAIQIRCRASSYTVAAARLQSIRVALHKMQKHSEAITGNADVTAQIIEGVWLQSSGLSLGLDENNRSRITDNWDVLVWFEAAPLGCAITLTGDIAAMFGGQPLDISGQSVSKTVPESPAMAYIAGGSSTISGWSGWRAVGYKAETFITSGSSEHTFIVVDSTYATYVGLLYAEAGAGWAVLVSGVVVGVFAGTSEDKVAIRVDGASGDVEVRVNGVTKTKADIVSLGGLFSGAEIFPAAVLGGLISPTLTEGDTYEAQIYTSATDLADFGFPAGTLDWCGNPLS